MNEKYRRAEPIANPKELTVYAFLAFVGVCCFFVLYRIVNLDEGWYLWAARLVYQGEMPYRNFTYTQTPLLPYIYGIGLQLFDAGLYQGRIITVGFALLMAWFAVQITRMRTQPVDGAAWDTGVASATVLLSLGSSLYIVAYYTYSATYALGGALLLAALWMAARASASTLAPAVAPARAPVWQAATMGVLLALGVAARLSLIAVIPLLLFYLWRRHPTARRAVIAACAGAFLLTAALVCGPFLLHAPDNMVYNIFGFHVDRVLRWDWHLQKIGRMVRQTGWDFWVLLLLNGVLASARLAARAGAA